MMCLPRNRVINILYTCIAQRENFRHVAAGNKPVAFDLSQLTLKITWLCWFAQQRGKPMLQGDDRVIWHNLFKVLAVLIVVTFVLVALANFLS
jgi:hypothetical protein